MMPKRGGWGGGEGARKRESLRGETGRERQTDTDRQTDRQTETEREMEKHLRLPASAIMIMR